MAPENHRDPGAPFYLTKCRCTLISNKGRFAPRARVLTGWVDTTLSKVRGARVEVRVVAGGVARARGSVPPWLLLN